MPLPTRNSLFLLMPFFLTAMPAMADSQPAPAVKNPSYLTFGTRLGEETVEGFADLIYPLVGTENNLLFFNPRFSLKDEGANEGNIGLGYRRRLADWLVGGANIYFDSRESEYNNRFNQWGAGLELFSDYIDFRANYYDADNDKELIGSYGETVTESTTRTSYSYGAPWATNHEIVTSKTKTERTTTTVTSKFFEQFEAGMDGWDSEIGCKLPFNKGPEVRIFAGYYDYDNPVGEDLSGGKGRLEIKTGSWLTLDAEVFEDEALNDTDYFIGFRLQVPLTADLSWQGLKDGLLSSRHRDLDQRMRGEMVIRDVRVQSDESDWQEDLARRQVTRHNSEKRSTEQVVLADHITFVDGDNNRSGQDGTNENPYDTIQQGADNAGDNNTIFVYEAGGTATGRPGAADGGGAYDEQVVLQKGQTLTSTISWSGHGGGVYRTERRPVIRPTAVGVEQQAEIYGISFTIAPVISMAADTVVRRMELDATAAGFAAYGDPSVNKASTGLYANIEKTTDTTLRVEDNRIVTEGDASFGLGILADDSTNAAVTLSATDISTRGEFSPGIVIDADDSANASIHLAAIEVATEGNHASGITVEAYNSADAAIDLATIDISTAGYASPGIGIFADDSSDAVIMLSAAEIATSGGLAHGIDIAAINSSNAVIDLANTNIFTRGETSWGIYTNAIGSTSAAINLAETAITSEGDEARGIYLRARDSADAVIHLAATEIATAGEEADGIYINADTSTDATIKLAETEVATTGSSSDGIYIFANNSNATAIDLVETEITTAGEEARGMDINADHSTDAAIHLAETDITTERDHAQGIYIHAYDSTDAAIHLAETAITTVGEDANGVFLQADHSTDAAIHLAETAIATTGDGARGIVIEANNSGNAAIDLAAIRINTAGDYDSGIRVYANNSGNAAINMVGIDVTTAGYLASGASIEAENSTGTAIDLSRIHVVTTGNAATGLYIKADDSGDAAIDLARIYIDTEGEGADGITLLAYDSTNTAVDLAGAEITTEGEEAHGITLRIDDSANAAINLADAEIITEGNRAEGIFIAAENASSAAFNLTAAEITTEGDDADGLRIFANYSMANTIEDNNFIIRGSDSWGMYIGNGTGSFNQTALEADNTFYIHDPNTGEVHIYTP